MFPKVYFKKKTPANFSGQKQNPDILEGRSRKRDMPSEKEGICPSSVELWKKNMEALRENCWGKGPDGIVVRNHRVLWGPAGERQAQVKGVSVPAKVKDVLLFSCFSVCMFWMWEDKIVRVT